MKSNRLTFDQLYARRLAIQREQSFNYTVVLTGGIVSIPLAIFKHPAWLIVTGLAALMFWFHRSLNGGVYNMNSAASRQACEFMLRVRKNGRDRSMMPLACVDNIMHLALMETCENKADGPGTAIAQNLRLACASCKRETAPSVIAAWWKAKAAFKPFAGRAEYLRKDGTCAHCEASEGWFESSI